MKKDVFFFDEEQIKKFAAKIAIETYKDVISEQSKQQAVDKPPLGLLPFKLHTEQRLQDIKDAMYRYHCANKKIPMEWVYEKQILDDEINAYPKNEQAVDNKDWEIVSYSYNGEIYRKNSYGEYVNTDLNVHVHKLILHPENAKTIHSVRRISDGEVFTVGDIVEYNNENNVLRVASFSVLPHGLFLINPTNKFSCNILEAVKIK